jgi:hypothetical protein
MNVLGLRNKGNKKIISAGGTTKKIPSESLGFFVFGVTFTRLFLSVISINW